MPPSAFFLLIPGSLCLGKKRPPRFLFFPLLCQPNTSLPGRLGTHVAPEAELGNEDSGNVHLRSPSVTGRAARFLIRAFWGSEPGWTCSPYAYRDSGDSAPLLCPYNQPALECGQTEPTSTALAPEKPQWSRVAVLGEQHTATYTRRRLPHRPWSGEVLPVDGELGGLGEPKVLAHSCAKASQSGEASPA